MMDEILTLVLEHPVFIRSAWKKVQWETEHLP
jgi:hypothetical protein